MFSYDILSQFSVNPLHNGRNASVEVWGWTLGYGGNEVWDDVERFWMNAARYTIHAPVKTPIAAIMGDLGWVPFRIQAAAYSKRVIVLWMSHVLLNVEDEYKRALMFKLRAGIAPLRIETGRYEASRFGQKGVPINERICFNNVYVVVMVQMFMLLSAVRMKQNESN